MSDIHYFIDKFKSELDLQNETITPNTQFQDEEYWDSLNGISIFLMIEEEYNVDIQNEDLVGVSTIEDFYNLILSKK